MWLEKKKKKKCGCTIQISCRDYQNDAVFFSLLFSLNEWAMHCNLKKIVCAVNTTHLSCESLFINCFDIGEKKRCIFFYWKRVHLLEWMNTTIFFFRVWQDQTFMTGSKCSVIFFFLLLVGMGIHLFQHWISIRENWLLD